MAKGINSYIGPIVGISIGALLFATLGVTALSTLAESVENATGLDPTVALFLTAVVPILIGVSVIMYFLPKR